MLIRVPTMAVLRGPKRLKTFATIMLYTPVPTIASDPTNAAGKKKRIAVKYQTSHMVHQSPRAVGTGFCSMERSFLLLDGLLVHTVGQFPGPRNLFPSFGRLRRRRLIFPLLVFTEKFPPLIVVVIACAPSAAFDFILKKFFISERGE